MSAELRVRFLGEHQDARTALAGLNRLLQVVQVANAISYDQAEGRWRFAHLGLGSVEAGIAPLTTDHPEARQTFDKIVDGFAIAEKREGIPGGWNLALARLARDLIAEAGTQGILVSLLDEQEVLNTAQVTRRAQHHLESGMRQGRRDSIGSVIGQLDSVTLHDRREARLWPERGGPAVIVRFNDDQIDLIRDHWGARVEAAGRITRDAVGDIISLRLRDIERLPTFEESPPLSGLVGLDPDFTGGKPTDEYLREIRGQAR